MDFITENSKKLQNLGLEGKVNQALNVFTLGSITQTKLLSYYNHILLLKVKCAPCIPSLLANFYVGHPKKIDLSITQLAKNIYIYKVTNDYVNFITLFHN
jgi:hypothetical protein